MQLNGKAAIVTGSATGIGRSTTLALARRGCHVVINYTRSENEARQTMRDVQATGARALLFRGDVSDDAAVRLMVAGCEQEFGRLDVLVNAAGTTHFAAPEDLEAMTDQVWHRIFNVNVHGTFQATRAAAPLLQRSGQGAVVNLASIAGLRPAGQAIPYAASKAAVVNMTVAFARILAPTVRVNAVAPGWMEGRWMQAALGDKYDSLMQRRAQRTPLQRVATPEDVAQTILSLIEYNDFVTGQVIVVDGGYSLVA
ncbi:MAG: SDR family oxidoreductase [Acidobacteria bacterium]|nr:SDR family oxidoreductase [Acidobacteriota bacterium]